MTNDKLNLKPYLNCSKEIPCSACSKKGSCLLKAVEMVSKSWGRAVTRGGKYGCPITPEKPTRKNLPHSSLRLKSRNNNESLRTRNNRNTNPQQMAKRRRRIQKKKTKTLITINLLRNILAGRAGRV